jgi:hypothetical protein
MKKIISILIPILLNVNVYAQSCTSTVYYDNMETFTWLGDWWTPALTAGFFTNASVSSNQSAVIYGSGNGTSGLEQDWYTLPNITGLNPAYSYRLKFRLASYTFSASTATTRGLDVADYLSVLVSTNGGITYNTELRITGNSNAIWPFTSTGTITHTANGTFTNSAAPTGDVYQAPAGTTTTGPSTIILNLPAGITQVAVDLYCRVNSAGEEFWIDNVELIEIIPTPTVTIAGVDSICNGTPMTLTASGAQSYSWNNGITNGVSFTPTSTATYTVTATDSGMLNGLGVRNTCSTTSSINVQVKPVPDAPTLSADTSICPSSFIALTGSSNIGTLYWYDSLINGTLLGTGSSFTTPVLIANTSFYAQSELNGCISTRSEVIVTTDADCTLPIYLLYFKGENKGKANYLNWVTAQEINSSHFEIEKSKDGFNFNKIGIVNAVNINPYKLTDENAFIGYNYYRLKMVDLDGSYTYSPIIALFASYNIDYQIYPNPFEESFIYSYYSENREDLEIFIYDLLGQLVYNSQIDLGDNINAIPVNVNDLSPGFYRLYIKHKQSGFEVNQTIIKK